MEIKKFNASQTAAHDRIFHEYGKKIYQRIVDSYNSQGYKLYYYKDFNLIEITNVKVEKWSTWGRQIFFLNQSEYEQSMKGMNIQKDLYDKYIEAANTVAQLPLSTIVEIIKKSE